MEYNATSRQFLLPILAFIVPFSDTLTVVINRLSKGKSPFVGGKDHTTVIHAVKKIVTLSTQDLSLQNKLKSLKKLIIAS